MSNCIRYCFIQKFPVPAEAAYTWCTDYQPDYHGLLGNPDAKRVISWITPSTVLIKDSFPTSRGLVEKEKLVQLYPDQHMWVSTHISGPNKYSQFIYQIVAEGKAASRLDFTALHIEYKEGLTEKDLTQLAQELCDGDSAIWRLFAAAMAKELSP